MKVKAKNKRIRPTLKRQRELERELARTREQRRAVMTHLALLKARPVWDFETVNRIERAMIVLGRI